MLAGRDLVVRRLDLDPEVLERVHHLLADLGAEVLGEVEVAGRVVRQRLDGPVVAPQQEELELRPGVEDVALLSRTLQLALQDAARIAGERIAVRREDVADDARAAGVQPLLAVRPDPGLPGDGVERVEVGHEEHVGLGDAGEALDARAVEPLAVLDRLLQLVHRHLDRLHLADDVGELEADEAQVAFLRQLQGSGKLGWGHREPPKSDGMDGLPR